jgi:cell division protein FtsQ
MVGGRVDGVQRRRTRAASAVVPFPRSGVGDRQELARLVPSGRSLLLVFALVAGILAAVWAARVSSVFAVEHVRVEGAPPAIAREIEDVTATAVGQSLLEVDARRIEDTVRALPSVAGASVDRAFPHTLVIKVSPERPVAVAHRRTSSWLVTGGGKVIREIEAGSHRGFPRLWIPKGVGLRVGGSLPTSFLPATRALAAVQEARIPRRVKAVRSTAGELTLVLRHGPEIRLGGSRDLRLKLAVAARVFPLLPDGALYLDVSVPERPVTSRYNVNP